jgi:hypothetical protein
MTRKTMNGWQRLSVAAMTVWTVLMGIFAVATTSLFGFTEPGTGALPLWMALLLWLTPPLLVFLFQWVTRWIYRGFRGD